MSCLFFLYFCTRHFDRSVCPARHFERPKGVEKSPAIMKNYFKITLFLILVFITNQSVFAQIPDFFNVPRADEIGERRDGCDYLIITPEDSLIKAWGDTLRNFREIQGIITKVVTMGEVGYNHPDSLKAYLQHGYEQWNPAPAAVLLLGDYASETLNGITTYALTDHPEGQAYEPYLADNKLVDFNDDGLPEIVIARMPASNGDEARLMVQKTLQYERHPYSDEYYYVHPITAMGYQRSRWFQLCTEIVAGYLENKGKDVIHLNGIHQGTPDSVWSTGQRTDMVLDYFGPTGLGYIPTTMEHLTDWSGNASQITQALENGSYLLIHRDHGSFRAWGEPEYTNWHINHLNNDKLTFIMSANCQTGDFSYGSDTTDCLAERFLRIPNGAVGIIAASQFSYSYVNDTYVWGFFDYLYPDFMPDYGPQSFDFKYPAFANAYGKYFLQQSEFPFNASMKPVTYNLFHYFGDAFLQLYSDVPQQLTITHPENIRHGQRDITIHADECTHIALSVDNQLIARGKSNGNPLTLHFTDILHEGEIIKVVATKQNHYRHESYINVTNSIGIDEIESDEFKIYPTITNNILHIEGNDIKNIVIFNILGQKIQTFENNTDSPTEIDCSSLPNGIYFIIISGKTTSTHRFIKN